MGLAGGRARVGPGAAAGDGTRCELAVRAGLTSSAVVAKPTKRPTKRKLAPATDKVMPTGGPREAVRRISRPEEADASAEPVADADDAEAVAGTRARRAAQAEKAEAGSRRSWRRSRRVTAKGTVPTASTRYTPPSPHLDQMPSPLWVPVLMFTLLGLGMLTIILNYVEIVPGGETSNWYLLLGLGFILAGIITATQYR